MALYSVSGLSCEAVKELDENPSAIGNADFRKVYQVRERGQLNE